MMSLKTLNMMNWLKNLMLFTLLILVIWLQKTDYNTKINEIAKKITDHDYAKFNKLTLENFAQSQANLAQAKMILLISWKRQILMIN